MMSRKIRFYFAFATVFLLGLPLWAQTQQVSNNSTASGVKASLRGDRPIGQGQDTGSTRLRSDSDSLEQARSTGNSRPNSLDLQLQRRDDPTQNSLDLNRNESSGDSSGSMNLRSGGTSGTSGGGDRFTTDFARTAEKEIYPWLKVHGAGITPPVDAEAFRLAIDPEAMVSVDHVYESCRFVLVNEGRPDQHLQAVPQNLNGQADREREACYSAETKLIYISRARYPLTMQNSAPKRGLIAHEIFRKMGIEGNEHRISKQISILQVPVPGANGYVHNANECTALLNVMSSLTNSYVDVLKICYKLEQSSQVQSPLYLQEAAIARQIESTFASAAFSCNQYCEDASICNLGTPEGICRK
jgi:hypothetical protein